LLLLLLLLRLAEQASTESASRGRWLRTTEQTAGRLGCVLTKRASATKETARLLLLRLSKRARGGWLLSRLSKSGPKQACRLCGRRRSLLRLSECPGRAKGRGVGILGGLAEDARGRGGRLRGTES